MNTAGPWRLWCVVGVGSHARTKLFPALAANGQALAGVVSHQKRACLPPTSLFRSLEAALDALPPETCFLLATPPAVHAAQVSAIAAAGRDVFVEKPAFLTVSEAQAAMAVAASNGTILLEGFMYRHARMRAALQARYAVGDVHAIEIDFRIPAFPPGTFRQQQSAAWTSLHDIGCYVLALLTDLGLPLDSLALEAIDAGERLRLAGQTAGVRVLADVGVAANYVNSVALTGACGARTVYAPFFYGRPGPRTITTAAKVETIDEGDAFAAMLAMPRKECCKTQSARWADILKATACMERLALSLPNEGKTG